MSDTLEASNEKKMPTFGEFLESYPPGTESAVSGLACKDLKDEARLCPQIQLDCEDPRCDGVRYFSGTLLASPHVPDARFLDTLNKFIKCILLQYRCRNCSASAKLYAITLNMVNDNGLNIARKIGEWPPFGPRVPSRVITLIGPDRELFLKGRRAENQGLGIGAFAYYRRVIENQKNRLLDKIIEAAQRIGTPEDMVKHLEAAKTGWQFNKAIDSVRDSIPESLRIDGHNPLTLLHSAVSGGIHDHTDAECLELATDVREILFALAERIEIALKDNAKLNAAVGRLRQSKS